MQLDDLKNAWKQEMNMTTQMTDFDSIQKQVKEFDRKAKVSWLIEILACAGVIVGMPLMWTTLKSPSLIFQLGMGAMIATALFVAGKMTLSLRVSKHDNWTLATQLDIQIEKREKEQKLMRSVAYWCLAPMLVAVFLPSYGGYTHRTGTYIPDLGLCLYWTACLVFFVSIYYLNQHQLKTKIKPVLDQLYRLKRQLKDCDSHNK